MELFIQIPLRPISVNAAHKMAFTKSRFKKTRVFAKNTAEKETFQNQFSMHLAGVHKDILEFARAYNPETHSIDAEFFFYVPKDLFFTKSKSKKNPRVTVSKRGLDLDNCLKVTIDSLFKYMGIDDKNITGINTKKIPTTGEHRMVIRLAFVSFPSLNEFHASDLGGL